jgi:hypothetical protein
MSSLKWAVILALLVVLSTTRAEDPRDRETSPDTSSTPAEQEEAVFSRVYEYGNTNVREIKDALGQVMTEGGKSVFLYDKRKVLVQDVKSQADIIDAVMVALIGVQKTPAVPSGPNIKIEIGFDETGTQSGSGIGVRGNVGGRDIRFGNRRSPGVDVNINSGTQTRSRVQSQFLVVQSGGAASLNVVREVPVVDYFYGYAGRHGLWEERQLRWERVGTQLVVEPVWKNGLIEVTVLPRITAWSQGREYGLDVRELATRVTVAEGRRVHLGGFSGADDSFHRNFFGIGENSRHASGGFTIRASRATTFRTPE